MNQRIAVRAIIRRNEKTFLMRRANGRETILGKYELPGGRLEYGEQPEDALGRYLRDEASLTIKSAQLFDVVSYIDHDNRDIQYILILYLVSLDDVKITLSQNYDHYIWEKMSKIHQDDLTESAKILLGVSQQRVESVNKEELIGSDVTEATNISRVIIYSDGGSRGNPGPSAAGFVIMDEQERMLHEGGMYLGITTNNIAEYHGVSLALEKALSMGARIVDFRLDSLLVVNQMNGIYQIKNRELWPINEHVHELMKKFDKVTYAHVRREYNQLADGMVNKILNAHAKNEV